ncbi:MAG: RDD family protein [Rhodopirellula sp.]|nr:RDD family protein [Rhodopirellula sp.]
MPVKVRCECGAGISAPDAARGKVIKCRKCGEPVRVPKGSSSGDGGKPRRKKAAGPRPSVDDDDFFSALDLERGEDQDVRICPKCAVEVDEEDIECPNCGVDIETGVLSQKQKKKRKRKGPDIDLFPKVVWSGPTEFLKKNKSLALRLIGAFSLYATIFCVSLFMAADYCIPEDTSNPDTPLKVPVVVFWGFLTALSGGASMGCFWQLFILIIQATMEEQDSLDRFNFDFFVGVALGFKILLWPLAVMGVVWIPVAAVVGLLVAMGNLTLGDSEIQILAIVGGIVYLIPLWAFPVAMSHMAARYTYRAYIPYDVFRFGLASMKGVCHWWLVTCCAMLPAILVIVPLGIFYKRVYAELGNALLKLVELCGIATEVESRGFMFSMAAAGIGIVLIIVSIAIVAVLLAFSAVFVMRATGLFSYYFQKDLGLGDRREENVPAGFWVRYLALMIDILLVSIFIGIVWAMILGMREVVIYLEMDGMVSTLNSVGQLVSILIPVVYFVFTESSPGRGTMGMNSVGIMITDMEGNSPIERGAAVTRLFGRLTLIVGAFTMSNDPEKQTIHDKMSKTRVIWRKLNV